MTKECSISVFFIFSEHYRSPSERQKWDFTKEIGIGTRSSEFSGIRMRDGEKHCQHLPLAMKTNQKTPGIGSVWLWPTTIVGHNDFRSAITPRSVNCVVIRSWSQECFGIRVRDGEKHCQHLPLAVNSNQKTPGIGSVWLWPTTIVGHNDFRPAITPCRLNCIMIRS